MKKALISLALMTIISASAQSPWFEFIDREYTQMTFMVDPTLTDKGAQIGIDIQKIMLWGFAGVSFSHYAALEPSYTDMVGFGGVNFHMFRNDRIRYYGGFRLGMNWRGQSVYPLIGLVCGIDIRLNSTKYRTGLYIGGRLWVDHREDQKNQFYGDDTAYNPGIIFSGPLSQENGAITISLTW
ncbi:MAG: hypothetical protein ACUZ8H_01570 [Candidatus Anammoxibacter sp.]